MPHDRLTHTLRARVDELDAAGPLKGEERTIAGVLPPTGGKGPRLLLEGYGERPFLRMNSNNYLGLTSHPELIAADEKAVRRFGAGPGAVRFISGAWSPHAELERRLADFHGREAAMVFSSAYMAMLGLIVPLIDKDTAVVSDALNHNCIINAIRLGAPKEKRIYAHNAIDELDAHLADLHGKARRALVITDGVFSMRGDIGPLDEIMAVAARHDEAFPENVIVVADDSHGVGAMGATGRGAEEICNAKVDILGATLGKALGANGGYVVGPQTLIDYLRETASTYIYSNPITPGEAAAAVKAIDIVEGPHGRELLARLHEMTTLFETGLTSMGFETIPGPHPVTPLMVRDTPKTQAIVQSLFEQGILATGLSYPVVPRGDESIRFQLSAEHTPADVEEALAAVRAAAL